MATLQRTLSKSGKYFTFSIPGVRGQLHVAPKMVQGSCPTSIEVTGIEFAAPGTDDAEKAAAAAVKAQTAVDKATARLLKAQAKLGPVVASESPASDVPETPAVETPAVETPAMSKAERRRQAALVGA